MTKLHWNSKKIYLNYVEFRFSFNFVSENFRLEENRLPGSKAGNGVKNIA
jgi:hypothetical protein